MAIRAEIDPLAMIFSTKVFLILTEIKHPRVDRRAIQKAVQGLSASERRAAGKRASELAGMAAAVTEELAKAG
jgi:hypothetical protein